MPWSKIKIHNLSAKILQLLAWKRDSAKCITKTTIVKTVEAHNRVTMETKTKKQRQQQHHTICHSCKMWKNPMRTRPTWIKSMLLLYAVSHFKLLLALVGLSAIYCWSNEHENSFSSADSLDVLFCSSAIIYIGRFFLHLFFSVLILIPYKWYYVKTNALFFY